ncbi:hypothetical protein NC653_011992 [Populus alba x Populus x berolinensis]|uniref:Uncharacterized protein n=1 Tax=Populus alba x Populus x berolinensis TaxID=444605 RepID=A0AAD6R400_9ROSI|nr:hypothetical protein NC653_011992 [Populus alba x Populus x berolinensis]
MSTWVTGLVVNISECAALSIIDQVIPISLRA